MPPPSTKASTSTSTTTTSNSSSSSSSSRPLRSFSALPSFFRTQLTSRITTTLPLKLQPSRIQPPPSLYNPNRNPSTNTVNSINKMLHNLKSSIFKKEIDEDVRRHDIRLGEADKTLCDIQSIIPSLQVAICDNLRIWYSLGHNINITSYNLIRLSRSSHRSSLLSLSEIGNQLYKCESKEELELRNVEKQLIQYSRELQDFQSLLTINISLYRQRLYYSKKIDGMQKAKELNNINKLLRGKNNISGARESEKELSKRIRNEEKYGEYVRESDVMMKRLVYSMNDIIEKKEIIIKRIEFAFVDMQNLLLNDCIMKPVVASFDVLKEIETKEKEIERHEKKINKLQKKVIMDANTNMKNGINKIKSKEAIRRHIDTDNDENAICQEEVGDDVMLFPSVYGDESNEGQFVGLSNININTRGRYQDRGMAIIHEQHPSVLMEDEQGPWNNNHINNRRTPVRSSSTTVTEAPSGQRLQVPIAMRRFERNSGCVADEHNNSGGTYNGSEYDMGMGTGIEMNVVGTAAAAVCDNDDRSEMCGRDNEKTQIQENGNKRDGDEDEGEDVMMRRKTGDVSQLYPQPC